MYKRQVLNLNHLSPEGAGGDARSVRNLVDSGKESDSGSLVHDLILANLVDSGKESDSGYRDNQMILSEHKLSGT